jgi:tRNA(Arg) A34 adenosine deaminase TadA
MTLSEEDERFLRRAIELAAAAGRTEGQRPYAALLVLDGEVVAEDRNTVEADRDITAHPELKLARWAARELPAARSAEATMFTSCRPCPMCAEAIARAGLGRVVFALSAEQHARLRPPTPRPDVRWVGPALFREAARAVTGARRS